MGRLLKPKVLEEVQRTKGDVFRTLSQRVNLSYRKEVRIPLMRALRMFFVIATVWSLVAGSVTAPTSHTLAADTVTSDAERKILETQLHDLESQINQYEDQITGFKKQGNSLKGEISNLNNKVAKLNLQIQAINFTLSDLNRKISDTQSQITVTEQKISSGKDALSELVRNLYKSDHASLVEIFLKNPKISDFFADINSLALFRDNLRVTIDQISTLHDELQDQKDQYAVARSDAETLRDYQASQKQEADKTKQQKNQLLAVTSGQESKYQTLLKATKATAAQIRGRIFQLLGGGELSFEQAYQYAKLASGATGVRPALILAVLDRESALGRNVGRCSYKTAMNPKPKRQSDGSLKSDVEIFLEITRELNIDPDTITVSCPNRDGYFGGAMGPAQFIPSTWQLYRESISKITGRTSPSPWNNADAFVATALYLRDSGAANASIADERKAAARYYAGSRWPRYLWSYGEAVISRARIFQEDIDTII